MLVCGISDNLACQSEREWAGELTASKQTTHSIDFCLPFESICVCAYGFALCVQRSRNSSIANNSSDSNGSSNSSSRYWMNGEEEHTKEKIKCWRKIIEGKKRGSRTVLKWTQSSRTGSCHSLLWSKQKNCPHKTAIKIAYGKTSSRNQEKTTKTTTEEQMCISHFGGHMYMSHTCVNVCMCLSVLKQRQGHRKTHNKLVKRSTNYEKKLFLNVCVAFSVWHRKEKCCGRRERSLRLRLHCK